MGGDMSTRASLLTAALLLMATAAFPATAWCADQPPQFDTKAERIGGLRLDMPERDLGGSLPCRQPSKSRDEYEGATGLFVQNWRYPDCGVQLKMGSDHKGVAKVIESITVTAPSQLVTTRGIRIGSTEDEVAKAYARFRDAEESKSGRLFVAGSIYDGLIFNFANGKVARMFLGAAAE